MSFRLFCNNINASPYHLRKGREREDTVRRRVAESGVPVMGHLGITKQKIVRTGSIQIQGRTAASAARAASALTL